MEAKNLQIFDVELNPLHHACGDDEMRPNTRLIEIRNGIATATNTAILIRIDLSESSVFTPEQLAILEGKYIHNEVWKEMSKCDILYIDYDRIVVTKKGINKTFEFSEPQGEFFKLDNLIQDIKEAGEEAKRIMCYSPKFIQIIAKVFNTESLHFSFTKGNQGTLVYPFSGCGMFAVLMPRETADNRYFF